MSEANSSSDAPAREIELTFSGDRVVGVWYDPALESTLCALCGKECTDKMRCYNTNPYCG